MRIGSQHLRSIYYTSCIIKSTNSNHFPTTHQRERFQRNVYCISNKQNASELCIHHRDTGDWSIHTRNMPEKHGTQAYYLVLIDHGDYLVRCSGRAQMYWHVDFIHVITFHRCNILIAIRIDLFQCKSIWKIIFKLTATHYECGHDATDMCVCVCAVRLCTYMLGVSLQLM